MTHCREGPCSVGKTLRIELVQAPHCDPCQCIEKPLILLTHRCKGPCSVGELLCIELVQGLLGLSMRIDRERNEKV